MPVPRSEPTRRRPPGERRAELLRLLREDGRPLTVGDLAPRAGLHPNTVRAHLEVLVRGGHVVRRTAPSSSPGRPRELYEATGGEPTDRNYELLATVLAAGLARLGADPAALAAEAGRAWAADATDAASPESAAAPAAEEATSLAEPPAHGTAVACPGAPPDRSTTAADSLEPAMRMLRAGGFAPELAPDGIRLHHCPFRELAAANPEVVCGVHLGLIQGALTGGTRTATRILPFVQPDLCIAEVH